MPAAAKAPHAPRLHASVNALGARNNFPCVDSLESTGTGIWTAASTNADAAGNQYQLLSLALPDAALYRHSN